MTDLPWLLKELEALAERVGLDVRYEALSSDGGFCRVAGRPRVIISTQAPLAHRVDVLASALRQLDLGEVYLLPKVRDVLSPG